MAMIFGKIPENIILSLPYNYKQQIKGCQACPASG
jgi:hypothetical protein